MSDQAPTTAAAPATTAATTTATAQPGSGLGGADTSATVAAPAKTTTTAASTDKWSWTKDDTGAFSDGWRDRLPDDLKGVKDLEKYKDLPSMARTLVHQQKMIGADKLPLPGKDAKPEDWEKWDGWNRLGRPESPDKYDLSKVPALKEGIPYSYEGEKKFLPVLHKLGLTQTQVNGVLSAYRADVANEFDGIGKNNETQTSQARDAIHKEYGAALREKMGKAENYAYQVLGDSPETEAFLKSNQYNPAVIKLLVSAAEATREDRRVDGKSSGLTGVLSPSEAKAEITELMQAAKDPKHPLNNKFDPAHATQNARWAKLHEWANPQ